MIKILLSLLFASSPLTSAEQGNVLIYTDPVQVNAEVSLYETLTANKPITGTIMITHDENLKVDEKSFRISDEALQVKPVNQVMMSPASKMVVSIYSFEISGKKSGAYTLPAITVEVGGKSYQSPPINLLINP